MVTKKSKEVSCLLYYSFDHCSYSRCFFFFFFFFGGGGVFVGTLSLYLSFCLALYARLLISLYLSLPISLSLSLSLSLSIYLSLSLSLSLLQSTLLYLYNLFVQFVTVFSANVPNFAISPTNIQTHQQTHTHANSILNILLYTATLDFSSMSLPSPPS